MRYTYFEIKTEKKIPSFIKYPDTYRGGLNFLIFFPIQAVIVLKII